MGREDGDCLEFEVRDNGCGMSPKEMEEALNAGSKGYGMQNVHYRIRLYYGAEYGLKIESRTGEGTRVVVRIPKRLAGEP